MATVTPRGIAVLKGTRALGRRFARAIRNLLALGVGGIVLWSFIWVAIRPMRKGEELGDRVEITMMHWGDKDADQFLQGLVDRFEQANAHIRVKRVNIPAFYTTKLQTLFASGDPADIMLLGHKDSADYAGKGLLLELDDLLKRDEEQGNIPFLFSDFQQEVVNAYRTNGVVTGKGPLYGLPTGYTTVGFYYNKALFDKAGIEYPAEDWTWDEFEEKACAIGKLDGCYGVELYRFIENIQVMLWTFGSDLFETGYSSVPVDDPLFLSTMDRIRSWQFDYPGMLTKPGTPDSGEGAFMAGKIGMLGPGGRWISVKFRKIKDFDWDYVQLPRGTRQANMFHSAAWCIAKDSEHKEEAWELLKHLVSPESQRSEAVLGTSIPSLKSVAQSEAFLDPTQPPAHSERFLLPVSYSKSVQRPSSQKLVSYTDAAISDSLIFGVKSIEEAFEELKDRLEKESSSPLARADYPLMPWTRICKAVLIALALLLALVVVVWWQRRPSHRALQEELAGYAMVSPWMFGFLTFTLVPMVISILLMFTNWSGVKPLSSAQWVGLGNMVHLFYYDDRLLQALRVTFYYAALAVPVGQCAALAVAMLMNNQVRGINFFRSMWYLPSALTGVGVAVLWLWIFNGSNGLLNTVLEPILGLFGYTPPDWFGADADMFGIPAFVIMGLWGVGGGMLIYLAGLNTIPDTLYEAARIDGAGWWKRFCNVTVPMLSPVILFNSIIAIIGTLQIFTQSYVMTRGGPSDYTLFYVLYLYFQAFEYHEMGYASAMAWFLFIIVLSLTLIVLKLSKKHVHYEGLSL